MALFDLESKSKPTTLRQKCDLAKSDGMDIVEVFKGRDEVESEGFEGVCGQDGTQFVDIASEFGSAFEELFFEKQIDEVAKGVQSRASSDDDDPPWLHTAKLESLPFRATQLEALRPSRNKCISQLSIIVSPE
jgi:hypothetical protein